MSKKVPSEAVSTLGALQNEHREIVQWQEGVRCFLGETLEELHDLIKAIEPHVQHEIKTPLESGTRMSCESADAQPACAVSHGHLVTGGSAGGRATQSIERTATGPRHGEPIANRIPQDVATATDNSDTRLAQLARRLEEKLEQSNSRENATSR